MALDKAALLGKDALKRHTVQIGPLGGEVVLRELSVSERLAAAKRFGALDDGDAEAQIRAVLGLVACSLCNDDDSQMFETDAEQEEMVAAFMGKSSAAVEELMNECMRINGLGDYGKEQTKETLGNSEGSPSASSS